MLRGEERSLKATLQATLQGGAAGLFEGVGELEDAGFAERGAEDLEADGEVFNGRFAAGDGDAGDTGEGAGDGVDVGEVHLEGVVGLFTEFKGGDGRSGRDDGVDLGEGIAEILSDERADFLALEVVGVVVAGGEDVGTKDDAPFHFGAETGAASFAVHAEESWIVCAEAVADAVIAGEIRRGFGGGDDVVGGDGVIGVGHADVDEFAAEGFEKGDAGFDFGADAGVHAFGEVVFGNADAETFDGLRDFGCVVRDLRRGGSGVARVAAGNCLEDGGDIANVGGEGADAVERRGEGDEAVAGDAAVAAHHGGDAAEGAGLADGATGVGAERGDGKACSNDGCGAAAGPAGNAVERNGILDRAVGGVFVGTAHGEFVAIGFAEEDSAGGFKAFDGGGVVGGEMIFEDFGAAGSADASGGENVLDGDGNSGEGRERFV